MVGAPDPLGVPGLASPCISRPLVMSPGLSPLVSSHHYLPSTPARFFKVGADIVRLALRVPRRCRYLSLYIDEHPPKLPACDVVAALALLPFSLQYSNLK